MVEQTYDDFGNVTQTVTKELNHDDTNGMDLTSAVASFNSLVGVSSLQQPAILRVAAGDPDNSYLVHKLEGTAAVGDRMPFGSPDPLDPAIIASIRQWIADGALR